MNTPVRILICALLLPMLSACSSMPSRQKIPVANAEHTIYFIYRKWHTSIMLDAAVVARYSKHLQADAAGQQFVRVGWGDGEYFTGKNKSFGSAAKALVASRYSALQVLTYTQLPFDQIPEQTRVPLALNDEAMRALIRYLDDSLVLDSNAQPIPLQSYGLGVGRFYQATGSYGLLSNCNTWSGRALQAAKLPVRSGLQLTAQSVFEQAKFISDYQLTQGAGISGAIVTGE